LASQNRKAGNHGMPMGTLLKALIFFLNRKAVAIKFNLINKKGDIFFKRKTFRISLQTISELACYSSTRNQGQKLRISCPA